MGSKVQSPIFLIVRVEIEGHVAAFEVVLAGEVGSVFGPRRQGGADSDLFHCP